ncbi:MAG: tetratricopeptide repeat protein [Sarcina sp.]
MKTTREYYNLGVKYFHKGNLEKAVANLDIAISHDLKNSAALNLRGMIFYIKGQGEKAVHSWKINIDFNDDEIAKNYIKAYKEDSVNEERYLNALKEIKRNKIKEAIELLEVCTSSDFNVINVRNALSYCYARNGQFEKARDNALMVLDKDSNDALAKENLQVCNEKLGVSSFSIGKKQIIAVVALLVVISAGFFVVNKGERVKDKSENTATIVDTNESDKSNVNSKPKEEKENKENIDINNKFDAKKLNIAIENKNYSDIHSFIANINYNNLAAEDKVAYDEANEIMGRDGLKYFYDQAAKLVKTESFGKAKDMLLKAYAYSKDTYLEEHTKYMLAMCYERLNDTDNAIKYYEDYIKGDYDKESEQGGYMDVALYKLALLNEKNNIEESKKYASRLVKEYKSSIYNNTNISKILEN